MSNLSPQTLNRLLARAAEEGCSVDELLNRLLAADPTPIFYQQLLNSVGQAVIVTDLAGTITYWNRFAETLYGWQAQEVLGYNVLEITPVEQTRQQAIAIFKRISQGETWSGEFLVQRKDGTQFPALVLNYPLHNKAGELIGIIGTSFDITQRKQAEEALEEERQNLTAFQEIAIAIGGTLKLDHVLDILLDQLAQLIPYDRASIMLFGEGELSFCKWRGFSTGYDFAKTESFLKDPATWQRKGYHLDLEQPIITPDVQKHPAWVNLAEEDAAVHSWMGIPLIYRGVILGVLNLDHYSIGFFTEKHAQLAYAVAKQAGIAIATAQLFGNLETVILQRTEELRLEKDRSETILRHVADAIVFTDEQANILFVNPAWEELNGYSLAEVQGKNARLLQSGRTPPTTYQEMWAALRAGKLWKGDLFNQRKDGSTYQGELTVVPVYLSNDQMQGFVGVMRDVTEHRELDSLKERFIADAAHDLGNPVTVLTTTLYLLRKNPAQLEQRLPVLDYQIKRLNLLVRDLLTISRLDRGHQFSEIEPIDLAQLTEQVIQAQHALALEKQIDLRFTLQPNLPPIKGDIQAIERVIVNLISNALTYTPAGGWVEVRISNLDHALIDLQVKDTGIGIAPHEIKQIFKRFFRSDQARQTADGTGLGLSIVEKIVEQHGGSVSVESKVGLGSTFSVKLPCLRPLSLL